MPTPLLMMVGFHCTLRRGSDIPRSLECYSSMVRTVNVKTSEDETPILVSERKGNLKLAQLLLERGADPHLRSGSGRDSLYIALQTGNSSFTHLLLKHGADPNARYDDGWTRLHVSHHRGDWEVARQLLKFDVDMNPRDNQGRTPLQVALENDREEGMQLSLEHGAESTSPLHDVDA